MGTLSPTASGSCPSRSTEICVPGPSTVARSPVTTVIVSTNESGTHSRRALRLERVSVAAASHGRQSGRPRPSGSRRFDNAPMAVLVRVPLRQIDGS